MATKTKNWEKLYLVLDGEGYGLEEFASREDAFSYRDAMAKKHKKSYSVAVLKEVRREDGTDTVSTV